ncbi:3-deoxy-D-manno-octulosonic-acid transferase [Sphaerotilus hippei]|uniref:3-deoxy-D-manno-octulosonic acid transferase n=1 Tax=Sphaerotilus hippei TaxID=744406 RepID=A0A318H4M5_9BURK|nr:3-deoxy-D-manno-octulosonic acid transferase [Sphaerotilus hippei]PXW98772.1 3-deoxy-D-manno-octulosonic-acid transferase [Sphaerotilus hippei]
MSTRAVHEGAWALRAYGLLMRLLLPLLLLRLLWRARREPLYGRALMERLGAGAASTPGALWLHAVSLGETRAAEPLIAALRQARPGLRLLLTHGTATGRETGAALLQPGDVQRWLPLDTPGATRRFLARHRPAVGVLMETEIWPALQAAAAAAGVPMVLANARLSERSLRRGQRLHALMRPAARRLSLALAQTDGDACRLEAAGVPRVEVCGNLKFDLRPDEALCARGRAWRAAWDEHQAGPVVLAAVWREGEDTALLAAWQALCAQRRRDGLAPARLVLVPRHPQRFDEVAELVRAAGLEAVRRSGFAGEHPHAAAVAAEVWIGDSLREMAAYYTLADVALLGGSFAPLGGQNLIEAAACGCPVVMGPHTFNFAVAAELAEAAGAARRVPDLAAALDTALPWCADAQAHAEAVRRARAFAQQHRGAAERMAAAILRFGP